MARTRIEIREARKEDLDQVVDLWEDLVAHHSDLSIHFLPASDGRDKWSKYVSKKFSEKSTKLVVAEQDDEIVGFMLGMLSPNAPIFKEKTLGNISDAYVRPELRKKGITREMLKVCLKWFYQNKVRTANLSVAAANFEARAAWGQMGFKPHMIMKRMDLDKYPAKDMIAGKPKVVRKKVVKGKDKKQPRKLR